MNSGWGARSRSLSGFPRTLGAQRGSGRSSHISSPAALASGGAAWLPVGE